MKRIIAILFLIPCFVQGAAVTHGVSSTDSNNVSSYASGAFTPAAGDLLVAFVYAANTVATGTMTDSQTLGFTKVTSFTNSINTCTLYLFVSNNLAAASSMTVTFDCTGDAATGALIQVARISGMTKTGLTAIKQSAGQSSQTTGTTPAPVFGASALTDNPTLGVVGNNTNPATLTPPTNWTEQNETGHATPNSGAEYVSRDSGFTGTTITWGGTSPTGFADLIVELDASGATSTTAFFQVF